FVLPSVVPGKYTITVTATGFGVATQPLTLQADKSLVLAVTMFQGGGQFMATDVENRPVETSQAPPPAIVLPGVPVGRAIAGAAGTISADRNGGIASTGTPMLEGRPVTELQREQYASLQGNEFRLARRFPLSTFSSDVDTASYANTRRFVLEGKLPPPDAVRVE